MPIVAGFHIIWTAYGWWLPNDPRGSSSHEIRVERIAELGELHPGRKAVQPSGREIRAFYEKAQEMLKHPLLAFTRDDIALIGARFQRVITERKYTCYACAIMPEHVHILIRKHRDRAEVMTDHLQQASRDDLIQAGRRSPTHPVWGGPGWRVFMYTKEDFIRIIKYIRDNPLKIGWPLQGWNFVKPYTGWLPARYH